MTEFDGMIELLKAPIRAEVATEITETYICRFVAGFLSNKSLAKRDAELADAVEEYVSRLEEHHITLEP
jgi:hypothetical protein